MYLDCPACSKRLQIADEKLPTDHSVRITCPGCQQRFTYDPRAVVSPANGRAASDPGSPQQRTLAAMRSRVVTYDANSTQALICVDQPAHQDACREALQGLGYTADVMPNQFKALEALREVSYRLFVLDASFDGTSLDTNLVLTFLRERPLEQRRYQFVVLCAPEMITADPMLAYSQSVNLVLRDTDIPICQPVIAQYLAEHELLYRTFREMRQQLGKEG